MPQSSSKANSDGGCFDDVTKQTSRHHGQMLWSQGRDGELTNLCYTVQTAGSLSKFSPWVSQKAVCLLTIIFSP